MHPHHTHTHTIAHTHHTHRMYRSAATFRVDEVVVYDSSLAQKARCVMCDVRCVMCDVMCPSSPHHTSHITHITHITSHTSRIIHHTHHTSYVTRHTSHITHYTSRSVKGRGAGCGSAGGVEAESTAAVFLGDAMPCTSHITHHTSHITHHTSHITHHTSHITHSQPSYCSTWRHPSTYGLSFVHPFLST